MARADTIEDTLADAGAIDRDAVVVGGGAAGLSAAVFLARYGLETLVLARGTSAIRQCAHLENYLGFPGGIAPERFLALGRAQAEFEGASVREERVESVERATVATHEDAGVDAGGRDPDLGGFRVATEAGDYETRYVLIATAYDGDPLAAFDDELETTDEHGFVDSDAGRTGVEGLYTAGWMTDEPTHQALTSAGHGTRAALSLIRDDLSARYWPELGAIYQDWVVAADRYPGDEAWHRDTREWFETEVLVDGVDDELAEAGFELCCREFLDRRLGAEERTARDREGQRAILDHLDDDVVREYRTTEATGARPPTEP